MRQRKALTFPSQRPNEHVILLLRRHWLILARDVVQFIVSFLIPPAIAVGLIIYTDISLDPENVTYPILVLVTSLYYLFNALAFYHDFVDYHLDIWILTDQRIISIEQEGLFHRVISELSIQSVQDVSSEVRGHIQTFFDYGHVYVQSAGQKERFIFEQVPHPSEIAKVVLQVHHEVKRSEEMRKIKESEQFRHQFEVQNTNENK